MESATPLGKLMLQWSDFQTQVQNANRDIVNTLGDGLSNALGSMIDGTATASEAFSKMAQSIVADIAKIIIKLMIQWAISSALGLVAGTPTMPQAYTSESATAAIMHTGGTVGSAGASRSVPVSAFSGAPRFQHGGTVGSGERPIVAEPGEVMLTREKASDIRARLTDKKDKQTGQPVTIANLNSPDQIQAWMAKNPGAMLNIISTEKTKVKRILES